MSKLWIIGLLVLLLAACVPLQITNPKATSDDCGCYCVAWQTNQDAVCKVTYCQNGLCYTSALEPEYGTLHYITLPVTNFCPRITITAIGRYGQTASKEIP